MARNKNKPKKGGAVVSPAEIPAGKTEVIVGASAAVTAAGTAVAATTPLPTFTQIGMAGMIGMLGAGAAVPATVGSEPLAPVETTTESTATIETDVATATEPVESLKRCPSPEREEKKVGEEKLNDTNNESLNESLPSLKKEIESAPGFYGYIKNFFRSIGGAISR